MTFTSENILLLGSILLFVSILISKTGHRLGIPILLLFLGVGMFFGSDGLGLQFNNVADAQFIGIMALSIILFTGGMNTSFDEIKPILLPGIILSTVGVLLTTLLTGLFIFFISDYTPINLALSFTVSLLLAATMSSTDSASVFTLLRSQNIHLKENLRPTLELESGSNDPVAYLLTILLIQIATANHFNASEMITELGTQFFFGGIIGFATGKFAVWIINRINIFNNSLYPILLLSLVFFTFTITNHLSGNGYLAVYISGIVVGNHRLVHRKEINTFMDGLTWLFQIIMFLTLGLLVNPHEMIGIAGVALLIGLFMILIARPVSVLLCLLPFRNISSRAKLFISWVGLRGAVPIIFATYPVVSQVEGSHQIFNIVFFITLLSLLIQGTTISKAANLLGLALPAPSSENEFGVEIPEEMDTELTELTITPELLSKGHTLSQIKLPEGTLVILIKRSGEFLIPNGRMELLLEDKLLLISDQAKKEKG